MKTFNKPNHLLHDQWSSKWVFILAATGAAVGLGNIWRFPYMTGAHGGSAFVLLYLLFVVVMGLPIMISEILIGRRARQNPVTALRTLAIEAGHSKHWSLLGWWGALALMLVLSFYSVVAGWSIAYLFRSTSVGFHHLSPNQINQIWEQFLASPLRLILWHSIFMALTIFVIIRGVQQGLEKATKYMMPGLYLILFLLVIYASITGDIKKALHFLFDFHLEKIDASVVIAAMGHAFFTLALGAGAMLTYGAYVPKRVSIVQSVIVVAVLDVLVAILSGCAIFPLVFSHHLAPDSGPGLMFVSLPIAFADIPFGNVVGGLFFILLLFAAWTSAINLAEPLVIILMNKTKLTRTRAGILVGIVAWFIGLGSVFSFNIWKNVRVLHKYTVFDLTTNIPTDFLLPLGGLGFAIFGGWIMHRTVTKSEINTNPRIYEIWSFLIRYIAPIAIMIVFIDSIWP